MMVIEDTRQIEFSEEIEILSGSLKELACFKSDLTFEFPQIKSIEIFCMKIFALSLISLDI